MLHSTQPIEIPNLANLFMVHGYNVEDGGAETIDQFLPACEAAMFQGFPVNVVQFDYGYTGLRTIIKHNKDFASNLVTLVDDNTPVALGDGNFEQAYERPSYAIGHSNGCAIILEAANQGAIFKRVLLINPALPVGTLFPENMGEVLVVYTKHDKATLAAKWANRVPFLRLFIPSAWGAMGTYGSLHADYNYNMSRWFHGHSDIFHGASPMYWGDFFVDQLLGDWSYFHRTSLLHTQILKVARLIQDDVDSLLAADLETDLLFAEPVNAATAAMVMSEELAERIDEQTENVLLGGTPEGVFPAEENDNESS